VCVTGLVVVDTHDYWSPFGQVVILLLIHLGGLGFMTSASLLFLLAGRRLSLRHRLLAGETLGRAGTANVGRLVARIAIVAVAIELTGAALLLALSARDGLTGHDAWRSLFTAISAFNNAGIDLEGGFGSLTSWRSDTALLFVVMALVMLGGLGYAVLADVAGRRRWQRLAVETKIVLATSVALWLVGAAAFFLLEHVSAGNTEGTTFKTGITDALAMSVFARSSGFAVVDMAGLQQATLFMLSGLMFIGGASASTAGGIKVSTFSALFVAVVAALRGRERVTVFEREITTRQVYRALSVAWLSVALVFVVAFALATLHDAPFIDLFFEAVSAFGTAGLSTGVTPDLPAAAQVALILAMYIGRLGPLTIALALMQLAQVEQVRYPAEEISIG
jgi:trk system potassium uptake protein TrkH